MDEKQTCRVALVEALVKCPTLAKQSGRDQCVALLEDPIGSKVERDNDARDDLTNIVLTCLDHEGGLASLVEAVDAREKGSVYMPEVRKYADALAQAIRAAGEARPVLSPPIKPVIKPLEGACALVIGVSKYEQEPYKLPNGAESLPFPNLAFPAEDAKAFHKFLTDSGCAAAEPLLDERATRQRIMRSIDDLCRQSKVSDNPLVVIFFSGHGARDDEERHYLVPHDGMRDDLFATALWSDTFKSALRQLPETRRVVVFVDACHAAGFGEPGVKGLQGCDPVSLVDEGRYVVASCLAEQVSREVHGHGIFSQELLHLLRFENDDDVGEEELELFGLCDALKQRVNTATHGQQKPWSNIQEPTGIVLAVNHARRELRQSWEKSLLDAVHAKLKATKTVGASEMRACLWRFILKGKVDKGRDELCDYFREVALRLKGASPLDEIDTICESLSESWSGREFAEYHARDTLGGRGRGASLIESKQTTLRAANAPASAAPGRPGSVGDEFVPALPQAMPEQVGAPRPSLLQRPQGERRQLSPEDVKGILEIIWDPLYGVEARKLQALLEKREGVSLEEYNDWCVRTRPGGDEESWETVLREIGKRFKAAWDGGQKPRSPLSVRLTP